MKSFNLRNFASRCHPGRRARRKECDSVEADPGSRKARIPVVRQVHQPERSRGTFAGTTLILLSLLLLTGCGSDWEKKLIRKRVKPPRPALFQVETVSRPYAELYREHFGYWKSWNDELIQNLGKNAKRERRAIVETRRHLAILPKYLKEEKAAEARAVVEKFDLVTRPLFRLRLSAGDYTLVERGLNGLESRADSRLHPKKVKDFILPTPIPIRLGNYEGAEPVLPSASEPPPVKTPAAGADSLKHGSGELTYEEYRARALSAGK